MFNFGASLKEILNILKPSELNKDLRAKKFQRVSNVEIYYASERALRLKKVEINCSLKNFGGYLT